jgi:hypothetical protein
MRKLLAALALALLSAAPSAGAEPPPPTSLRVDGGEESWHPQQRFTLRWTNPAAAIAAVHYRLLDPAGAVLIGDTRLPWAATVLDHLNVPPQPGAYAAQVWLEDDDGALSAPATASLRFDDARPGPAAALVPAGWLGRGAFPYSLHLSQAPPPVPLSGIRGYAVSIDALPTGSPCAGSGACGDAEIDLRAGAGDDVLTIDDLPEGRSYVHVAAVSGSSMPSASAGNGLLRVDKTDPHSSLEGVPTGWSSQPVSLTVQARDDASGIDDGGATAIRIDGGAPREAAGDSVSTTLIGSGVHRVEYYARDAAGNVNDGGYSNGRLNHPPGTAEVRIDREPPQIAFVAAQDPADPELLEARAVDAQSGIDPDRGSIGLRRVGSSERFAPLPTTESAGTLHARWDSSVYPPGEYEFHATAFDRAGNQATASARPDGSAMRLQGPLKLPVKIVLGTRGRGLRYGRGAWFGGRLLSGRRTPLADRGVRIVERFALGSVPSERVSTVRSDGVGRFGLHLGPGPSREVVAEVAPTRTTAAASSSPLAFPVHGRVVLHVSAAKARIGGRPIVFSGRIGSAGASVPVAGKAVQLEFRLAGLPWSEFRTVRSNRAGRFRYAYRFSDDDSRGVRFQFRAYAPAQAGWPFEPAGSLPVAVLGA